MSDSLQALVDRSAILSAEIQQRFGVLIAGSDFDIDFSAAPQLRFTGDEPITFRPHMIGSSVDRRADRTWHWGWDNLNEFPAPVVALSQLVRDHGAQHGIDELTQAELPLESGEEPTALTLAAKAITGAWAHYPVAAGGGTTVWVLLDDARLDPGEPELRAVVKALASAITTADVSDHRAALASYAELRGLRTAPLPDGGVRLLCADGSADVTFDAEDRVASCQAHPTLEGEAAQQYEAVGPRTGTATYGQLVVEEGAERTEAAVIDTPPVTAPPADPAIAAAEADVTPAGDPESAPEAEPQPDDRDAPASTHIDREGDQEPEKKGFFKRLFGR